jgi:expansin (peptidoglycan-binding protein)
LRTDYNRAIINIIKKIAMRNQRFAHTWKWLIAPAILALLVVSRTLMALGQAPPQNPIWLPIIIYMKAPPNPIIQGIATYYDATGDGACMFGPSPADLMVAAMNAEQYNTAAVCGETVHVSGPKGQVTVRIVDLCPECKTGHLDLSREAFALIADLNLGVVAITWQVVSPELAGPIAYHFKDGSSEWWTAVQVRNHRNPVAKLEYKTSGGQWINVPRTSYNYFVQSSGMGVGPYAFRVTDSYGNILIDSGIPHVENGTIPGAAQFPPGP